MKNTKQIIYNNLPWFFKNILVTTYNLRFLKTHSKKYYQLIEEYKRWFYEQDFEKIKKDQNDRFLEFIKYSKENNPYYNDKLKDIEVKSIDDIKNLPIISKVEFANMESSKSEEKRIVGYTGGSTGVSTKFYLFEDDYIERQANLDFFRGMYEYKFKDSIAWFSGKEIINLKDIKNNKFWVKDYLNNITYFSTFHLNEKYILSMIEELNNSKIEFMAGFPSAIYDIAYIWKKNNIPIKIKLKAIFPTSEPLDETKKQFLKEFFNCAVPDQYASSEGAHFIYECPHGTLHYDMHSGIFEIVDNRLLVTSFTTKCMPLIRFDIGDMIELDDSCKICKCGSKMPIVNKIIGRTTDYLYSPERGKVTVSNISNVVKYLKGIRKLQIIQNDNDFSILVKYISDVKLEKELEYELKYRLGENIKITYKKVDEIEASKNGKFKMIIHEK